MQLKLNALQECAILSKHQSSRAFGSGRSPCCVSDLTVSAGLSVKDLTSERVVCYKKKMFGLRTEDGEFVLPGCRWDEFGGDFQGGVREIVRGKRGKARGNQDAERCG